MSSLLFSDAPFSNAPGPTYYCGKLLQVKYIESERVVSFLYFSQILGATWRWIDLCRGVCSAIWCFFGVIFSTVFCGAVWSKL